MQDFSFTLLFMLTILIISAIVISWLFISKIFKKYNQHILKMRIDGSYQTWARGNRFLLLFARLFRYLALFCFAGFILLSIAKVPFNTFFLFELFFPFQFISIALYLILYLKIEKNQKKAV